MSATLKVLSAKQVVASHTLNQGDVLVIDARENSNYQLIDDKTGLGPQNIIAQRTGKDLNIFLEDGDMRADIVIKGYYGNENGEETSNLLVGQHENGGIYAYIPESGEKSDAVSMLAEDTAAPQALGGEDLGTAFWAFNPWWLLALVPLAAGIAIAAHNSNDSNTTADNSADAPQVNSTNGVTTVTPGADNTRVVINYTDKDGITHTATLIKDSNGQWQSDDSNVTVTPEGQFTIPTEQLKEGSNITATGTDDAGNSASGEGTIPSNPTPETPTEPANPVQPTNPTNPVVPPVTPPNNTDTTAPEAPTATVSPDGTAVTGKTEPNAKVTVTLPDGSTVTTTADANGDYSAPLDPALTNGEEVKVKATDEAGNTSKETPATAPDFADAPTIESPNNDGKVTVTPGDDNSKVEVTFKGEDDQPKTVVAEKGDDGKWSIPDAGDTGATVDPDTGVITIPSDKVKDGEPVNAKGTNDAGNTADADAVNAGTDEDPADKPTIESPNNDGKVTVTPGDDNSKVEVTFKGEDDQPKTVVAEKGDDGKWSIPDAGDTGATVDPDTGVITIPSDKVKDGEPVNAKGTNDAGNTADADAVNAGTDAPVEDPADKPTIESKDNDGTVTVKPGDDNSKVEVTFKGEDDQPKTVVAEKGDDGKWSIPDAGDTGATVDPDTGVITIPSDKVKDGEPVNAKGTNPAGNSADADPVNAGTDAPVEDPADKPTIESKDNDGTVTVKPGDDNSKVEVTFKGEDDQPKTVVAEKGDDGKWSIPDAGDTGATVDPDTGVITIPSDKVKDGEPVNAKGTNPAGNSADADPVNAGTDAPVEDPADKPTIESKDNDGTVTVKPGDDNSKVEVTFKGEDDQPKTVVAEKGDDGKWSIPDAGDTGATVDPDTGVITIPSDKVKDGEPVNAKGTNPAGNSADADPVNAGTDAPVEDPADKPTIESKDNDGTVTVKPGDDNSKVEVTFKGEDDQPKTVVAEKGDDGKWSIPDAGDTGATVDPDTGVITIPSDKVKDGEPVNAKGTNPAGNSADADPVNAGTDAPVEDPADKPTIESKDNDGTVTVKPGDDNSKVEVTFKGEDDQPKTVVAEKGDDGKWSVPDAGDTGATVDPDTGVITIPSDKVKDGEPVNAKGTNPAGNSADADPVNAGTDAPVEDPADKPTIESKDNDGTVTVKPGDDNSKVEVTFKGEDDQPKTVVAEKGDDGKWSIPDAGDTGATVDPDTGVITIPSDKVKDGEPVNAKGTNDAGNTADADPVNAGTDAPVEDPADKPTIESKDNDGTVTVKPGDDNSKVEVTFKGEDDQPKTVVAEKGDDGKWSIPDAGDTGATVDPDTGVITIPSDKVKDGEPVNAKGTNDAGNTADADAVNAGTDAKDAPTVKIDITEIAGDKQAADFADDGSNTGDVYAQISPAEASSGFLVRGTSQDISGEITVTIAEKGGAAIITKTVTPADDGTWSVNVGPNELTGYDSTKEYEVKATGSSADGSSAEDIDLTASTPQVTSIKLKDNLTDEPLVDGTYSYSNFYQEGDAKYVGDVANAENLSAATNLATGLTNDKAAVLEFTLDKAPTAGQEVKVYRYTLSESSDAANPYTTHGKTEVTGDMVASADGLTYTVTPKGDNVLGDTYSQNYRYEVVVTDKNGEDLSTGAKGTFDFRLDSLVEQMSVEKFDIATGEVVFVPSGLSEVGATIEYRYATGTGTTDWASVSANADGKYNLQLNNFDRKKPGALELRITDAAGNVSETKVSVLRNLTSVMNTEEGPDPAPAGTTIGLPITYGNGSMDDGSAAVPRQPTTTADKGAFVTTDGNDTVIFGLDFNRFGDMGVYNGTFGATGSGTFGGFNAGAGDDSVQFRGTAQSMYGAKIEMGAGNDRVSISGGLLIGNYTIDLGQDDDVAGNTNILYVGGDTANAATHNFYGGAGNDIIRIDGNFDGNKTVHLGDGNNELRVGYGTEGGTDLKKKIDFISGSGDDIISVKGDLDTIAGQTQTFNLGDGDNFIEVGRHVDTDGTFTFGSGVDTVNIKDTLKGGTFTFGAGNDSLTVGKIAKSGTDNVKIDMGEGDDTITITGTQVNTGYGAINGGEGNDTIFLQGTDLSLDMSQVLNVETIDMRAITGGTGNQKVGLTLADLQRNGDTITKLYIKGDVGDTVDFGNNGGNGQDNGAKDGLNGKEYRDSRGTNLTEKGNWNVWEKTGSDIVENGVVYDKYTYRGATGEVNNEEVYIQQGVSII